MADVMLRPLSEARDVARFGGKASELARSLASGLPVPLGGALCWEDAARLEAESAALGGLEVLEGLGASFAVRSSGVGEDSSDASFAGQHLTRLGVGLTDIREAAVEVVRSASGPGALAYRERIAARSGAGIKMGVVVQQMIASEVSGVLFSRHPVTKEELRFVEASFGLGEVVVAGLVTPDQFQFSPGGNAISMVLGEKDVGHFLLPDGRVEERSLSPEKARERTLDDARLRKLDELASRAESLMGGPVDLEWALSGDQLFLLQMRPITA